MSNPPCAGFLIFTPDKKKILLVMSHKGTYGFPKGKREQFRKDKKCCLEDIVVAAYRELMEETGLTRTDIMKIGDLYVDEPSIKGNPAIRLYLGFINNEKFQFKPKDVDEIAEVKFFTVDEANGLLMDKRKKVLFDAIMMIENI